MKKIILWLIKSYKKYISSGHYCRMIPTCSEYTYEAVEKYGTVKGLWMGVKRVIRCNPWSKGGVDLVE
jgi:putative membrane protein insertion efficiency factor